MPSPFAVVALAAAVPHLAAARAEKPPVLDGKLDDAVWEKAPASDAFTQKVPVDGKPPSERTVVRILFDANNIYVGIDCPQKEEVIARLTRRDRQVEADSVAVVLDTRGDGKTAYEFSVNAAGVLADALHFNDTDVNQDWDENWEAAVARTKSGWSAELRIPLRALRFPTAPIQSWGLQVRRYVSALQELDEWAHIPRDAGGEVSRYGRLDNLVGLKSKSPVELRPFVVGRVRHHDPQSTTLARGFEPGFSAGLDLKWHVSQALTLDATFLPDFGQVEADQVILNLSTYEIYYPEKRPFFLEGIENFSTPLQLLYTRRIGRAPAPPEIVTDKPIREQLVHDPVPSTIYGAAKLTGDLGGRWSVGGLVAMTGRQTVEAQAQNGTRVQRLADPLTSYKVLRLKREIGETSHVGMIFTATNRLESPYDLPLLPGIGPNGKPLQLCPTGDTLMPGERCFHDAYVAGADGKWRSSDGEYVATAQVIGTLIKNGPPRTLPDGTVVASGDTGPAVMLRAAKEGGKDFAGVIDYEAEGRRADFNDLGFMKRQNQSKLHISAEYRTLQPKGATLETHTGFDFLQRDNLSLENQFRGLALINFTKFKNFWGMFSEVHVWPRHWDDREMGDGASLERGALWGFEVWLGTDSRKRVYAELWTQTHFIENGMGYQGDGKISIKVLPQWDVDLLPNWVYARGEPRYFGSQGNTYLFGRQRAQSLSLTLRSTYTFTPRLTLQAYAQAILESVHYSDYHWFPARGRGTLIHLGDLHPVAFPVLVNPDYEAGTINASLVGRWEYVLGSTLFLVYTHSQNTALTPRFGDGAGFDFFLVKPRAAEDALQLKLSYWWGG
jgi:hypothetical protein